MWGLFSVQREFYSILDIQDLKYWSITYCRIRFYVLGLNFVQELYSGSSDRQILVWSPPKTVPIDDEASRYMIFSHLFIYLKFHVLLISVHWKQHPRVRIAFLGFLLVLCFHFSFVESWLQI